MLTYQTDLVYTRVHSSEVQIWPILLQVSYSESQFAELLSGDEKERAARFHFDKDRQPYVVCRGALRMILERYLEIPARDLRFRYSALGKPQLALETDLRFNVSHSGDLGILAFTRGCELGVDVERIHSLEDISQIARRFFSTEECNELMSMPAAQRPPAFFRCWTRKEAFIKATGEGLSAALDQFQVSLQPNTARFVHINQDAVEASAWTLQPLELGHSYAAAVAYRTKAKSVQMTELLEASDLTRRG